MGGVKNTTPEIIKSITKIQVITKMEEEFNNSYILMQLERL